jgi:hypothetical protein
MRQFARKQSLQAPLSFPVPCSPFPFWSFDPKRGTGNPEPETEENKIAHSNYVTVFVK